MYLSYYGLTTKPFAPEAHPEPLFMSEGHREALAALQYAIVEQMPMLLLTGEAGIGKTALLESLTESLARKVHVVRQAGPFPSIACFYERLAAGCGFDSGSAGKVQFLLRFTLFLQGCSQRRERMLLVVDDGQQLSPELLEEIRFLGNQDRTGGGVLTIFLVGRPGLAETLENQQLLSLKQRLGIRCHLPPLTVEETGGYLRFRLRQAGGVRLDLFSREAVHCLHQITGGIPRLLNAVAEQALFLGFGESAPQLNARHVQESLRYLSGQAGLVFPEPREEGLSLKRILATSASVKNRLLGKLSQLAG